MAKSTKSQEIQTGTSASYTPDELEDPAAVLRARPMLGGELKSVGTSSSQSSAKGSTSSDKPKPAHQAPVQTTENLSTQQETVVNSDAVSTGGAGQVVGLSPSDKEIIKPATAAEKRKARATTLDDDDFAALQ